MGDTVYDADGNILFQTEAGNIVSPEVRETAQGVLWIGSRDGKNALYYDNTCVSGQYDDIQPYDIGDTQLFTASSDGTEALMDTDGREITKTTGDIMLLASGLAAVTDGNTVTYWNQGSTRRYNALSAGKRMLSTVCLCRPKQESGASCGRTARCCLRPNLTA